MAPNADPLKHRSAIRTPLHGLTSILVKNEDEAVNVCVELVQKDGVRSFLLCPGFTNKGVSKVVKEAKMVGADARKAADKITGEVKDVTKKVKDKI